MTEPGLRSPDTDGVIWANATWLGSVPFLLNVVAIFSTGFITRQVGAAAFGQFSISLAIVGLSLTVTDLGLRALAIRDLAHVGRGSHRALGELVSLRLLMGATALALTWLTAALLSARNANLAVVTMASSLAIIPTGLAGILSDGLVARDRAKATSGATLLSGLILTVVSVIAVWWRPTALVLAASYVIGPVVNALILWRGIRAQYGVIALKWQPIRWRAHVRRAIPFFRVGISGVALVRVETPMVGLLFGEGMAGIYAAAISLADRTAGVIDSVTTATLPTLMRFRGDAQKIAATIGRIMHPLLSVVMAGTIMAVIGATSAVTVVFGAEYAQGGPVLAVALVSLPLMVINTLLFEGFVAMRRVEFITGTVLRGQLVNGVLLPLVPLLFGLPGVPLAKLAGGLYMALARARASRDLFPELWSPRLLRSLLRRSVWALPIPVVLLLTDLEPLPEVVVAGGGFLVWVAGMAYSGGLLRLRRTQRAGHTE